VKRSVETREEDALIERLNVHATVRRKEEMGKGRKELSVSSRSPSVYLSLLASTPSLQP